MKIEQKVIDEYKEKFMEAINDDLNMPLALSIVWEIARNENKSKDFADLLIEFDKVLGLDLINSEKYLEKQAKIEIPEEIQKLVEERKKAREEKNWKLSDEIRDELKEKGYMIKDTKDGMVLERL